MTNEEILLEKVYIKLSEDLKGDNFVVDRTGVKTVETINCCVDGLDPLQKTLNFNGRKTPAKYVRKESDWYNSMDRNIKGWVDDIKIWRDVSDKDGLVNSNYGWCIFSKENFSQYDNCIGELINDPNSRRAVMIYNRPSMHEDFNKNGMNDFICTQNTQHLIRDDKLVYLVFQRSQDMIFGLFNDLAWHHEVYEKMYDDLTCAGVELDGGYINLNIGSAHVYERHFDMLEQIVSTKK